MDFSCASTFSSPCSFAPPTSKEDLFEWGKVQGEVTRMIKGVEQLPHKEPLSRIGWKRDDRVRLRERSINHTRVSRLGTMGALSPRGRSGSYSTKREGGKWKTWERQRLFTQRVIKVWSTLPPDAADTCGFKKRPDRCWKQRFKGDCWALQTKLLAQGRLRQQNMPAVYHSRSAKPCSSMTRTSVACQHRRGPTVQRVPALAGAAPSYSPVFHLSLMLKTPFSDRFLLASHIRVTRQPSSCENNSLV